MIQTIRVGDKVYINNQTYITEMIGQVGIVREVREHWVVVKFPHKSWEYKFRPEAVSSIKEGKSAKKS